MTRSDILDQIEIALESYDQLLLHTQQLAGLNRPTEREYRSVARFVGTGRTLVDGEADFIYHKLDIASLRPGRETAWLDHALFMLVKLLPRKISALIFEKKVSMRLFYCKALLKHHGTV